MGRKIIDYEGQVFCPAARMQVTVLSGRYIPDNENIKTETFSRVMCPYLVRKTFTKDRCEKGGTCGLSGSL